MTEIVEVKTKAQMRKFVNFPLKLFKGNKKYVPCFYAEEMALIREDSVYNEFSKSTFWLCYKDGKIAGRIGAIEHFAYMEKYNQKIMRFTRFDCINDFEVAKALFDTAENFARSRGYEYVHGPWGYTDMDKEGMMTEGFEYECTYATLWNDPYYPEFMARLGYEKECEWIERRLDPHAELDPKIIRLAPLIKKRYQLTDVTETGMSTKEIVRRYVPPIFDLLNICYADLDGFTDLTPRFRDEVVKSIQLILDKKFISVLVDPEDNLIGVGVAVRGLGEALNKSGGKFLPFGWIHFLKALSSRNRTLELFFIAVRPDFQSKGLTSIMMDKIMQSIKKEKIEIIETNCTLEDNHPINNLWDNYPHIKHKRRRCYIKKIV